MKKLLIIFIAAALCTATNASELSPTAKVESRAFTSTPLPPGIGQSINWLNITDGYLRLGTVRVADISMDTVVMMFSAVDSNIVGAGLTVFRNLLNSGYVRVSDTSAMLTHYARYSDTANIVANRLKISDTLTMLSNRLKISDTATMLLHYVRSLSQLLRDSSGYLVPNSGNRGLNSFADINSYGNITGNTGFFATTGSGNVVSGSNTDILGSGTFLRGGSNRDKSPLNVWGYNGDSIINATLGGIYLFKNVVLSAPLIVTGSITNTSLTNTLIKTNSGGQQVAAIAGVDYATPGSISADEVLTRTGAIVTANSPGTNLTMTGAIQAGSFTTGGGVTAGNGTYSGVLISNGNFSANAGMNVTTISNIGGSSTLSGFLSVSATTLNGTIGTAAQPNITTVGTLAGLSVTGSVQAASFTTAGVVTASGLTLIGNSTSPVLNVKNGGVGNIAEFSNSANVAAYINNAGGGTFGALISNGTVVANGTLTSRSILPATNDTYDIGSSYVTALGAPYKYRRGFFTDTLKTDGVIIGLTLNGTLGTASQPNITGLGTLTGLTVNGNIAATGTITASNLVSTSEVSFTPTLIVGSGTVTYTISARYQKSGNMVSYTMDIVFSAVSTPSGNVTITGMPFSSGNHGYNNSPCNFWVNGLAPTGNYLQGFIGQNTSTLFLYKMTTGSAASIGADLAASTEIIISGFYFTD